MSPPASGSWTPPSPRTRRFIWWPARRIRGHKGGREKHPIRNLEMSAMSWEIEEMCSRVTWFLAPRFLPNYHAWIVIVPYHQSPPRFRISRVIVYLTFSLVRTMAPSVNDAALEQTEERTTAMLVHLRKLLRVRNRLCSPLLRLPTETILRILSFFMAELDSYYIYFPIWGPVCSTCHRIREIMCGATELWWKVDCIRSRSAHVAYMRSGRNPRVIVSNFVSASERQVANSENILDHWRDERKFRGNRLHTLEFTGIPSIFAHFSWILERSLPHLERLKINIAESMDEDFDSDIEHPVPTQLPVDMPLRVLDLRNIVLPWSSLRFTGLRELHLNFRDCHPTVTIPEDELFGIFDASPQLERLSLLEVGHEVPVIDGQSLPPRRILKFPNLTFLKLDNDPIVVRYTLEYMDLPVITSLEIRSFVLWDIAGNPKLLFPDDRLPKRLFPNPPTFAVGTAGREELDPSMEIEIGGVKIRLDFSVEAGEFGTGIVMSSISQLVPSSVTALKLDCTELDEWGWRYFFASHPEVRSIECTEFCGIPVSSSLWDALLPAGEGDSGIPCPKLESISIGSWTGKIGTAPLVNCLRNRQTVGFKLRHLKITDNFRGMPRTYAEELAPFVEVVEADKPSEYNQRVSLVSADELSVC